MDVNLETTLDKEIIEFIAACMQREHPRSYLISVLGKVQEKYGYLSRQHMHAVAHIMRIPTSRVYGVATFYHFFRLRPRGKHQISICMGTACFVKGADRVLEAFKSELGIDIGETTKDGIFSLDNTRCLGVCGLAPVVTINNQVYSQVTPQQVPELINKTLGR
ncbi:NADH-quinone oxidoreductase subunit NuoE [candidate division FCPU426 bacterium]|nr:NADH-quinone oxidoreductase subunit NuoE [candidate division FCPU426 bacterium]